MIKVDTLCNSPYLSNTYIVGNDLECIVIDPSNDVRDIIKLINNRNLVGIFLTHAHFDHFKTLLDLYKKINTTVYLYKNAIAKIENSKLSCAELFGYNYSIKKDELTIKTVSDNESLVLESLNIKIYYTPGHTDCGISILIDNLLFTGDTLFKDGFGRFDLPTASVFKLKESLKRLFRLDDNIIVYPGHDEATSIKDEKNNDYILRFIN